ncbi:MAG TPA: hypothetical protein P5268_08785 [Candidatus Marinimicrobia bacterium]|nr:hypothetical protein [Candidatus Neomarinimicrobiota bacterium]HRS52494.1 hypothetical protein [Candidatus Neomarinimicrobiota bacterium]HRU93109.1 hypothetical protein [Candidatus Neomarinimicrobiota bacterium]
MKKIIVGLLLLLGMQEFGLSSNKFSQVGASWLLIPVSPTLNGMGEIGVCLPSDDIYAGYFNPANGIYGYRGLSLAYSGYKTDWLPELVSNFEFGNSVLGLSILPKGLPLQMVFSLYKTIFDFGMSTPTDEDGNLIYRHHPLLTLDAFSFASRYKNTFIKIPVDISAGMTMKKVVYDFDFAPGDSGKSNNVFYDAGVLLSSPLKIRLKSNTKLDIIPAFGYSISNIGKEIYFKSPDFAVPAPRYARVGLSLTMNLALTNGLNLIGYRQGRSAGDVLYHPRNDGNPPFQYQSGLGDIDFVKNVLDYQGNEEVEISWGQEVVFLDFYALRWGRYLDLGGDNKERRTGYSFYSTGLLRLIGYATQCDLINQISEHLTVSYNHSKIIYDNYYDSWTPRAGTKFKSWTFTLNNVDCKFRPSETEAQNINLPENPISVIAGINISDIRLAEQELQDKVVKRKSGYKIGIESRFGWIVTGMAFDQRGANYLLEATMDPDIHLFDFNIIDNYNYISFYGLLSVPVIKRVRIFGGLETGDCISRKATLKIESGELSDEEIEETEDVPPTNINWDYGLKAGLDFMIFKSFGIRAAYYHGFNYIFNKTDVFYFLPNSKHRNIELSLIYKL